MTPSASTQPSPSFAPDATAVQTIARSGAGAPAQQEVSLSPYHAFLYRQSMRILARGGSEGDIADYITHAEGHHLNVAITPPLIDAEQPGMVRGLAQQALQGVTFGFGDEALGTLYGLLSGEGGQAGRDQYRAELALFGGAHPKAALAAQLGGAALLPVAAGARLLGIGGKIAAGAIGGGSAALATAGNAQGDLSDRAKAALMAAPFGVALGVAFPAAAALVGRGVAAAASPIAAKLGPKLQTLFSTLPGSPGSAARSALLEALTRDGLSLSAAADRVEQRAALGLPTTVADVGGEHTLALANTAKQFQTPAQQALAGKLMSRQAEQGARLLASIGTGSRLGLQNAYELAEQLMAQRATQADPLYRQAFALQVPVNKALRGFLAEPIFQEAYATGRATSLIEDSAKMNRGLKVPELPQDLKDLAQIPVRALDYMKRGLDHMIDQAGREGRPPLKGQTASALRSRLNDMLALVGKQVPVYADARKAWQGYSQQLDALDLGGDKFLSKAPEVIAQELAASPNPEMYKIGALQTLANVVHGVGPENANVAQRFFGARLFGAQDRTMAARMRALFPDQGSADEFMDRLAGEAASTRALRRLGGGGKPNEAAGTQALNPAGMVSRLLERTGARSGAGRIPRAREVANEVTMLFTKGLDDPNELVAMLRSLDRMRTVGQVTTGALRVAGGVAGAGGRF